MTPHWAARKAAWSVSHFHRKFRLIAGESYLEYLRGRRLHRAAGDLLGSRLEIRRIAWDAGFAHVPAFHNAFLRRYGRTPAAYRRCGEDLWPAGREPLDPDFLFHLHEGRIDFHPGIVLEPGRCCVGLSASAAWSEFGKLIGDFRAGLERMAARPDRIICYVRATPGEILARGLTLHVGVEVGRMPSIPENWETFFVPPGPSAEFRHHGGAYARTCFHIWRHWSGRGGLAPGAGHTVEMDWDGGNPFTGRRPLVLRVPVLSAAIP